MIGETEIPRHEERPVINNARGNVVDIDALARALRTTICAARRSTSSDQARIEQGRVRLSPLQGLENVILTPHIGGGSTEETQSASGRKSRASSPTMPRRGTTFSAVGSTVQLPPHVGGTPSMHIQPATSRACSSA